MKKIITKRIIKIKKIIVLLLNDLFNWLGVAVVEDYCCTSTSCNFIFKVVVTSHYDRISSASLSCFSYFYLCQLVFLKLRKLIK